MEKDDRRIYRRKRTDKLTDHIKLKEDSWSNASKRKLKNSIAQKMKRIFVSILEMLDNEKNLGNIDPSTHKRLRAKSLNVGNDQIRTMGVELDARFNIEALNYHVEFPVKPLGDQEEGQSYEG